MKSRQRIADLLCDYERFVSGEELGRGLGISRTAVWKQIKGLEDEGFVIDARPRLGYRVRAYPDKLLPLLLEKRLKTSLIGRNVYYYPVVDSTNSVARGLAETGAVEGSVVIAEEQTGGKGRFGRQWVSPKQANILISIILRPDILPHQVPRLAMLGAVSVADSVHKLTGMEPQLKWPNELLLNGRKVGGILTELNAELDMVGFIILGIGINVNFDLSDFPQLAGLATSLSNEAGVKISRIDLLQVLLEEIERNYNMMAGGGLSRLVERWNSICWGLGEQVELTLTQGKMSGVLKQIDVNGRLVMTVAGAEQSFAMGEGISLSRESGR